MNGRNRAVLLAVAFGMVGCGGQMEFQAMAEQPSSPALPPGRIANTPPPSTATVEAPPADQQYPLICQKVPSTPIVQGIQAVLYHSPSQSVSTSGDLIRTGVRNNRTYRFDEIFVPARNYDLGFPVPGGDVLRNDGGEVVKTDYALDMTTALTLGPNDPEGYYQFAFLSDDGATLYLQDQNSKYVPILADEGVHGPRVNCSPKAFFMKKGASIPMRLTYFQGPIHEIALSLVWRRWSSEDPTGGESQCNRGTRLVESDGRTLVSEMRDAGWKAVGPENFASSGGSEVCLLPNQ